MDPPERRIPCRAVKYDIRGRRAGLNVFSCLAKPDLQHVIRVALPHCSIERKHAHQQGLLAAHVVNARYHYHPVACPGGRPSGAIAGNIPIDDPPVNRLVDGRPFQIIQPFRFIIQISVYITKDIHHRLYRIIESRHDQSGVTCRVHIKGLAGINSAVVSMELCPNVIVSPDSPCLFI